ncbi:MAG: SCO family protein [Acidobacteria bacterium]|nr:SCO family protein [Acidobacteriota bacterium]
MKIANTIRNGALAAMACLLLAAPLCAQVSSYGDKEQGVNHGDELPTVLKRTTVEQHLNRPLPLDAQFVDETGKQVRLGDYFGSHKPAVLALVYYNCKMLCSEELDGLVQALVMVHLDAGKDFNVIVASIDTSDTPAMSAKKKATYVRRYDREGSASGWHFLTSPNQASIDALTQATGFNYVRVPGPDGKLDQFAHASAIQLVTADGKIAQYYMGVEYSPKDMLLGLIEASGNKIGSPVANILTYCYHYDPEANSHSLIVARVVQLGGMVTIAGLGGFLFVMFRKDLKLGRDHSLTRHDNDNG